MQMSTTRLLDYVSLEVADGRGGVFTNTGAAASGARRAQWSTVIDRAPWVGAARGSFRASTAVCARCMDATSKGTALNQYLLAIALLFSASCGSASPAQDSAGSSTATGPASDVLVLFDPATVRLPPPSPQTWGPHAITVRFTQDPDVIGAGSSSLDPMLGAGCACDTPRVKRGTLRVRLQGPDLIIDALCGHIWHVVHQEQLLFEQPKVLDDSNPAARGAVVDIVERVVTAGWTKRSGCG